MKKAATFISFKTPSKHSPKFRKIWAPSNHSLKFRKNQINRFSEILFLYFWAQKCPVIKLQTVTFITLLPISKYLSLGPITAKSSWFWGPKKWPIHFNLNIIRNFPKNPNRHSSNHQYLSWVCHTGRNFLSEKNKRDGGEVIRGRGVLNSNLMQKIGTTDISQTDGETRQSWIHRPSARDEGQLSHQGHSCLYGLLSLFKVNNRNTIKKCETCSKLTIKTAKHHWTYLLNLNK